MKLTDDLTDPKWMYLKAFLFLITGLLSAGSLVLLHPEWQTVFLLVIALWSFCRLYYFLFYVIEKYIDAGFRFAGLTSFLRYLLKRNQRKEEK